MDAQQPEALNATELPLLPASNSIRGAVIVASRSPQTKRNKQAALGPIVLPTAEVCRRIARDGHELAVDPLFYGEISAHLHRTRYPEIDERAIDRIIARRGYAYERGFFAYQTAIGNARSICSDAIQRLSIWESACVRVITKLFRKTLLNARIVAAGVVAATLEGE